MVNIGKQSIMTNIVGNKIKILRKDKGLILEQLDKKLVL